ncbi:two-component regulator propeller domain-containing protein [Kinneretia asaccharophila]|uniref:diguanylate cyclase n=1 Tax=Roseateles asaccharophilus TaxID=582607 RepID=A0A4R6N950_9BURK|nr:ligand-binding sensor domain-containing diguanylate cyclase [Roseateles asaccharophilus]MDN3543572.1 two-component regulator propeller domain-containing protein [Roseateles asaccharophilus]TDP12052.1 diguanylate cyclase (GGDEF)-like protein [Roseateles asaccharophilus]
MLLPLLLLSLGGRVQAQGQAQPQAQPQAQSQAHAKPLAPAQLQRPAASASPAAGTEAAAPTPAGYAALASPTAALSQYKLDLWQTEQGLPLNTVQALLQTRDGQLWVGTAGGLARFDGLRFHTFDEEQAPALSSEPVFGFMQDRQGGLWIGHTRGASLYRDGRFETAITVAQSGNRRVWAFAEAPDGTIWAASENGLLKREAGAQGQAGWTRYQEAEGLPTKRLRSLALDAQGWLWIGSSGGGLIVREPASGRFHTLKPGQGGFPHLQVRHVIADPRGRGVWAATAGAGLVHVQRQMDPGAGDAPRFSIQTYTTADGLPSDHLTALALDAQGRLWIGSWGAGLSRLEALPEPGAAAPRFSPALSSAQGLAGSQIWSLQTDREGSVWVGTWVGGLNRLRNRAFTVFGAPEGLAYDNTRAVLHSRDGHRTWVATAGGGLSLLDHRQAQIHTLLRQERGGPLLSDEISTLLEDERDGTLWVGSYTHGLMHLSADGQRLLASYSTGEGLPNHEIRSLLQDRAGRLWIGTRGGLSRLDPEAKLPQPVQDAHLPQEGITAMLEDRQGRLWFGTTGQGLLRLDRDGRFSRLSQAEGLLSDWIMALHEDERGTLWIGTNGEGLNRLSPEGRLASIRSRDGLWDGLIQVILQDAQGQFWMTCNRGFFRVARAELDALAEGRIKRVQSLGFGPGDALRSTTFAGGLQGAGARDAQGRLWLPSASGLLIVDPARLPGGAGAPQLRLTGAWLQSQWQALSPGLTLELPPGPVPLRLSFSADTLLYAERLRLRYRMQGLGRGEWVDLGNVRELSFATLPHGDYRLELALSGDGGLHWRELDPPLPIKVHPHVWQTPWFLALVLLATLGGMAALVRLRTRSLQARQAEMERLVAQRTEELRQANEHLSRLSFADSLTGLANRRRFDEAFEEEWRRARRSGQALSLLLADVDGFKRYNDLLGHQAGDLCLSRVASVIASAAGRAGDLAARYGGEEFVVLLPGTDASAAQAVAEHIRSCCEALALPHPDSPVGNVVTLSLGLASCVPSAEEDAQRLLARADAALYRAKQQGRNRVAQ